MSLPVVVFWLIIISPYAHATLPYDSMDKCEQGGKEITEKLHAKYYKDTSDYICQREIIDIPAVDYFLRP